MLIMYTRQWINWQYVFCFPSWAKLWCNNGVFPWHLAVLLTTWLTPLGGRTCLTTLGSYGISFKVNPADQLVLALDNFMPPGHIIFMEQLLEEVVHILFVWSGCCSQLNNLSLERIFAWIVLHIWKLDFLGINKRFCSYVILFQLLTGNNCLVLIDQ